MHKHMPSRDMYNVMLTNYLISDWWLYFKIRVKLLYPMQNLYYHSSVRYAQPIIQIP